MTFVCSNQLDKVSNTSENTSIEILEDNKSLDEDDLNDFDESGITTKIYKSNDSALDLFDNNESMLDPTNENDILNKDELISMSKIIKRKTKKLMIQKEPSALDSKTIVILPWIVSIVLMLLLTFIFKFLIQKTNT